MRAGTRTRIAIIATASAFGLTYGLSAPLIALELDARGVSGALIGLNAAMHALGVLLVAPRLPGIITKAGMSRPAATALVASALVLAAFPLASALWLWFVLRAVLGMASESLFVISESWLSEATDEGSRTRTMGIYVAAMSGGIALGPAVLSLSGRGGVLPFLLGSALALCSLAIMLTLRPQEAPPQPQQRADFGACLRMAPVAVGTAALNAAVEAAGLALLPLYAIGLGWSERAGTLLLAVLLVGAIVLQLPVGWLGDRMDRERLIRLLALASAAGAALWPLALGHAWLAWPLIFLWGGCFVGIYTLVLTTVGERFSGPSLTGVFGAMSIAWGIGALTGPILAGLSMHLGRHGLPFAVAGLCLAFFVVSGRYSRSRHGSMDHSVP